MSDTRKTLVILTPGFAKDEADSVCIPLQQDFVRALNEMYPELNVIILTMEYPVFRGVYHWFGNTVISFKGKNRDIRKLFLRRRVFSNLNQLSKQNNIVGLLSFWCNECALIAKRFADKKKIRHICWISGQDAKKENRYPARIIPRADELAALSDFLQHEFEKNHGIRPKYLVPPGIDRKQFSIKEEPKTIDVLSVGSLIPLKQYEILIEVVAEVRKVLPGLKAVIIGKGPEKNKLVALIEKKGLSLNITLTGELPRDVVASYMKRSKVLLHPSSYEGFGMVCIEALAAGAQVVSFVKPMNKETENWHIVASKEEMTEKAKSILKITTETGHKSIVPYTIEQTARRMAELFSF